MIPNPSASDLAVNRNNHDPNSMVDDLGTVPANCHVPSDSFHFPIPLTGRFSFPLTDAGWPLVKWIEYMPLTTYKPRDEIGTELWGEENQQTIVVANPTLLTFLAVVRATVGPSQARYFALPEDRVFPTLASVLDYVALRQFPTSSAATQLEAGFFRPSRYESTNEAYEELMSKMRVYGYICRRRQRPSFLTQPFLSDFLLVCLLAVATAGNSIHD